MELLGTVKALKVGTRPGLLECLLAPCHVQKRWSIIAFDNRERLPTSEADNNVCAGSHADLPVQEAEQLDLDIPAAKTVRLFAKVHYSMRVPRIRTLCFLSSCLSEIFNALIVNGKKERQNPWHLSSMLANVGNASQQKDGCIK